LACAHPVETFESFHVVYFVGFWGENVIQKTKNLIEGESLTGLYFWKVVGDIFEEKLIIEAKLIDKFEQFLHEESYTLGLSVTQSLETVSNMLRTFSKFYFSRIEN